MSCREAERWLHMLADGEISDEDKPAVEEHLQECPECLAQLALVERTRAGLAQSASELKAPDSLMRSVEATARSSRRRSTVFVLAAAAPALMALVALAASVVALQRSSAPAAPAAKAEREAPLTPLVAQAVRAHGLVVPVDVASADPRRVARFLRQRIGHSLEIPRLDHLGLDLTGGRVVSVGQRPSAQLVYQSALGKRMSVVAVPDPEQLLGAGRVLFDGVVSEVRVRVFRRGEVTYSFVGDAAARAGF